jgi:mono/diheme cytochrome c family protein
MEQQTVAAPTNSVAVTESADWQPQVTDRRLFVDRPSEQDQGGWAEYDQPFKFGRTPTPEELAGWDIDIRPDGAGLPPGAGSVEEGEALYDEKCAICHGTFGEGEGRWPQLAGGEGTLGTTEPEKTVGSYWPYASTLWDYVHRAMPYNAPQSLEDNEVYAIVAYVLYLNDLVEDDFVLDHDNLAGIEMPNRDGFFVDDRPDVQNPRCMQNCKSEEEVRWPGKKRPRRRRLRPSRCLRLPRPVKPFIARPARSAMAPDWPAHRRRVIAMTGRVAWTVAALRCWWPTPSMVLPAIRESCRLKGGTCS